MNERIICEFCGAEIFKKARNQHYKTKKCIKAREELEKRQCVFNKEKIMDLEKQIELLKKEKERELKVLKEDKEREILELRKEKENLQNIINKKDEFIQSIASKPTTTNNNNHFNVNNYFEGNKGIDYLDNQQLMNKRIEHCRLMMESTLENHGLNMKMIEETKKEQCEYLFRDETTGKWNVINTDAARNTFSICKKMDGGKTLYVKDPKGKMLKLTVDKVEKDNKRMIYKLSYDQDTLTMEEKFIQLEACISASDENLLTKVPVKSMI